MIVCVDFQTILLLNLTTAWVHPYVPMPCLPVLHLFQNKSLSLFVWQWVISLTFQYPNTNTNILQVFTLAWAYLLCVWMLFLPPFSLSLICYVFRYFFFPHFPSHPLPTLLVFVGLQNSSAAASLQIWVLSHLHPISPSMPCSTQ